MAAGLRPRDRSTMSSPPGRVVALGAVVVLGALTYLAVTTPEQHRRTPPAAMPTALRSPTPVAATLPPPWATDPRPGRGGRPTTPTGPPPVDLPVYFIEQTEAGPVLVRERMATSLTGTDVATRLQGAINSTMVANLPPSHFPAFVAQAQVEATGILVVIRGPGPNFVPSPADVTSIARTAQAVAELGDVPVTIRLTMGPAAGAREMTYGPYRSATMPPVEAGEIWVDAPSRGSALSGGPVAAYGTTTTTGPLTWTLERSGQRVASGHARIAAGAGRRPFTVGLGVLGAGSFRLILDAGAYSRTIPFGVS